MRVRQVDPTIRCVAVVFALLAAGCNSTGSGKSDGGGTIKSCFVGDPGLLPELVIVHRPPDGGVELTELVVPLLEPPQGGRILFVGPRVRNMDGCPLIITASLRDQCTDRLIATETKDVVLEEVDGWLVPKSPIELHNFSNLPACPSSSAERNINDEPYLLRIRAEDRAHRKAEAAVTVIPVCAEPAQAELCRCQCIRHFRTDAMCPPAVDSGSPPGSCPGT